MGNPKSEIRNSHKSTLDKIWTLPADFGFRISDLRLVRQLLLLLLLLSSFPSVLFAEAAKETVESFVAKKEKWNKFVSAPFVIEGRSTFVTTQEVKFTNCDGLRFKFDSPKGNLPNAKVVEVTGSLENGEDGKLYFKVLTIKVQPTDMDTLRLKRSKVDITNAKDWYELADWVQKRGTFYKDQELLKEAIALNKEGLTTEARKLLPTDGRGVLNLAAVAKSKKLPEEFWQSLYHEGFLREMTRMEELSKKKKTAAELRAEQNQTYDNVLTEIRRQLPGSDSPMQPGDKELTTSYHESPEKIYEASDELSRKKCHRLLYIRVFRAKVELDLDPNFSNATTIAARLEKELPELTDLSEKYRQKQLGFEFNQAGTMTRQEMLLLVKKLEEKQQPEQARGAKLAWLKAREPRLRSEKERGLMELGDEYLSLLEDREKALELYREAYRLNPNLPAISEWFTKQGMELAEGRWVVKQDRPPPAPTDAETAVKEGRVRVGMTGRQVKVALGGAPSSVARFATTNQITEIWHYDASGLSLQLQRRLPATEPVVTKAGSTSLGTRKPASDSTPRTIEP